MVDGIIQALTALALHYPKGQRTDREQALWLADYAADLDKFSLPQIARACQDWRRSTARTFPKVGELLDLIRKDLDRPTTKSTAWQPLSDEEYDALGLADKIRHQRILANEARLRGGGNTQRGPNGIRIPLEPGPRLERFEAEKERADRHTAEAVRLTEKLEEWKQRQGEVA